MEPYRFLPSERIAMTIEEFLEGCRAEPMLAADQLHQGYFEPWLRDAGRPDLAEAAVQVRQADIGPGPALEQFLHAVTLAPPRRRRKRGPAGARAAAGHLPTHEDTLIDAAPNEANPPSVTRLAPEEARRAFPTRRRLTDEQAREVTRVYAETDSPVEAIARQFGIGQSSVYRLAQQHGVPLRHAVAANAPNQARTPAGGGRRRGPRAGANALSVAKAPAGRGRAPGTTAAVQVTRRRRTIGGPSAVTSDEVAPAREPVMGTAESGQQSRSGGVVGHRFQVTFLAETVVEAADIQSAIRQVEALGATDITAITREG